ncbi:unnamed protein product [Prunus brigantina]
MRLFFFFVKIWFCFVDCTAVARSFLQVAATEEVASPLRVVQIEGISMILVFSLFCCLPPRSSQAAYIRPGRLGAA